MQALKKAERAKQEQKEALKQLEESNLKDAEATLAATSAPPPSPEALESFTEAAPEVAPPAVESPATEPSLDFPSLEMALHETEPPAPEPVVVAQQPADQPPAQPHEEPLLALDMAAFDTATAVEETVREEPKLELSFESLPAPTQPAEPVAEIQTLTLDESPLAIEKAASTPAVPAAERVAEAFREPVTSFSLELPSIIETAEVPPPPIILSEPPKPSAPPAEPQEAAKPIEEKPSSVAVAPLVAPLPPADEKKDTAATEKPMPSAAEASKSAQQKIAKAVFAAKQSGRNPRKLIYGLAAGMLLGIVSGGAFYVWQETQVAVPQFNIPPAGAPQPAPEEPSAQTGAAAPQEAGVPASPSEVAPLPADAKLAGAAPTAKPTAPVPASTPAATPAPAPVPVASQPLGAPAPAKAPGGKQEEALTTAKPVVPKEEPAKADAKRPEAPVQETIPPASGIRIVRGSAAPTTNPQLSKGYQALLAGDMEQAQQHYQQVLRHDSRNRDALQGTAVIAIQRQQLTQAAAIYTRMLENDPNDAEALSGLTALQGMSDPIQHESRLKNLLAKNPNATPAHFALGNLYFKQLRWAEAQSAYFRAYSGNPDNPDYAYNLAVSLDQLGQGKLALDYYQRALALAKGNPAAFDRVATQTRIRELTPQLGEEAR